MKIKTLIIDEIKQLEQSSEINLKYINKPKLNLEVQKYFERLNNSLSV